MPLELGSSNAHLSNSVQSELTKSFSSAADTAQSYPPSQQEAIIAAAQKAFLDGDQWAYSAGLVAVLLGAALVFFMFPRKDDEQQQLARYQAEDAAQSERRELAHA